MLGSLFVLPMLGCSLAARIAQTATAGEAGSNSDSMAMPEERNTAGKPETAGVGPDMPPRNDAGTAASIKGCPESLDQRLTVSTIDSGGYDIRYKKVGYDGFPLDESVLLSVSPRGRMLLAFRENSGTKLRLVTLNQQLTRDGSDLIVWAIDLGGLIAHDDGSFALLTRRDDTGEQLVDPTLPDTVGKAAVLIHILGTRELFNPALTGTTSITRTSNAVARDCAPSMSGRLAWNGAKYGAFFGVRGCQGDPHEGLDGSKLVYVDPDGNYLEGGWSWTCTGQQGMRLLPNSTSFTALCVSADTPFAGLNLVTEGTPPRQLAPEAVASDYAGGSFGSVVRMADGTYIVGWLSRGVPDSMATAKHPNVPSKTAPDIALLHLGADYAVLGPRLWLAETPGVAETNLHLAPYGPNRLLVVWDNIERLNCTARTCWGTYTGTSARLIDLQGNFLTPDVRIDAPPNSEQDIVVFPNNDLGWAFVPDDARNYAEPLPNNRGVPTVPTKRRLSVARLRYCE